MSTVVNHAQQAEALVAGQFRTKNNLLAFIGVLVEPLQELEYVFQQLRYLRLLDYADGAQLDGLGEWLQEPRAQRADATYRGALRTAILRNTCDGSADRMIRYMQELTGATAIGLTETGVMDVSLTHNGTRVDDLLRRLRDIAPAGGGLIYLSQPGDSVPEVG